MINDMDSNQVSIHLLTAITEQNLMMSSTVSYLSYVYIVIIYLYVLPYSSFEDIYL